jgi:hypothetical protein
MRLAFLTCATFLIGAASGAEAAGPALDDAKCQAVWSMVSPNGATISKDKVVPYIIDFTMVDTDADGTIDADEFKEGCKMGLVHEQPGKPAGATGGGKMTPENPMPAEPD